MQGKPPRPPKQTALPPANKSDHNAPDAAPSAPPAPA
jgi:hypothetical protein